MSEPTGPATPRSARGSAKASQDPSSGAPQDAAAAGSPAAERPPAPPTPTEPLPAASGPVPTAAEAAPAGLAPAGPPSGPPPAGPPSGPFGPSTGGPGGPPPRRPGLWHQATSTTGGLIAVVVAAALVALLVLGTVAAVGLVAVRAAHHDDYGRMERLSEDGRQGLPPGQQRKLDRLPQGPEGPRRQGDGLGGGGMGNGLGKGNGNGMGNGMGGLMRGAMGLGDIQHGEFTVQQDGKAVVMTLQRGTVTKSSSTSVTVKSDDGFTASYAIGTDTRTRNGAPAVGDSVLVVAQKSGAKAVLVMATRQG